MQQISNPKRSVIAIPGVRKRCRDEDYLPALNNGISLVKSDGSDAPQACGLRIEPFRLSETPYGTSAHAVRDSSSLAATLTTSFASVTNLSATTNQSEGNNSKTFITPLPGSVGGNPNSNSVSQVLHQPFSPTTASSSVVRVMGPILRPLAISRARYSADEVDYSWLRQYNSSSTRRKTNATLSHIPASGGKMGGKGSAVGYVAANGETLSVAGISTSSDNDSRHALGELMRDPSSTGSINIPTLEDAFTLLELHYRYLGYAVPAGNLKVRLILSSLDGTDPVSSLDRADRSTEACVEHPPVAEQSAKKGLGRRTIESSDAAKIAATIYGVPTHRLQHASDEALQALTGYWLVRRAAAGLHSDGLVPEESLPQPVAPTAGKAGRSSNTGAAASAAATASSAKSQNATVFSHPDAIPCHRRSLIPELCRDEQLAGPHGLVNLAMAKIASSSAESNVSLLGTKRRDGGSNWILPADALSPGDELAAFCDYAVPFTHRAWECPIFVQQPVAAVAATNDQEISQSGVASEPTADASDIADHLERFDGLSAALVNTLRRRELRAQQAMRVDMYRLALIRKEAEDTLASSLLLAADVLAKKCEASGAASDASVVTENVKEIDFVYTSLIPMEMHAAACSAEDAEW